MRQDLLYRFWFLKSIIILCLFYFSNCNQNVASTGLWKADFLLILYYLYYIIFTPHTFFLTLQESNMIEEKALEMRFNQILLEEMGKVFELNPLPLDPDLKIKYSDSDKNIFI